MIVRRLINAVPAVILVIGLLTAIGHFGIEVWRSPGNEWNDVRLAPSAGLLQGLPIYTPRDSGPMLGHVYGPIAPLLYLPAVWLADTPAMAIRLGVVIGVTALLVVLLPWLRSLGGSSFDVLWGFAALTLLASASPITWPVLFAVHPDVWSITWALAGCALLTPTAGVSPRVRFVAAAGFCFAVSIGCKQPMLLAPVGVGVVLGLTRGRRAATIFALAMALSGLALLGLASALTSLSDMTWNAIFLPSLHPWRDPGGWRTLLQGVRDLVPRSAPVVLALIAAVAVRRDLAGGRMATLEAPWFLPLVIAVANLPLSIVGRAKVGGSMNTLAYAFAFLVFAAIVAMSTTTVRQRRMRWVQATALAALVIVAGFPWPSRDDRDWIEASRRAANGFTFARAHPQQVYAPFHPLIGFYAERRLYHVSDAIAFREMAGITVQGEHVRAHVPDQLRWIATSRRWPDAAWTFFPECLPVASPPGLEGWDVRECAPLEGSGERGELMLRLD